MIVRLKLMLRHALAVGLVILAGVPAAQAQSGTTLRGMDYFEAGNHEKALELFRRAAERGDSVAEFYWGWPTTLGKASRKAPKSQSRGTVKRQQRVRSMLNSMSRCTTWSARALTKTLAKQSIGFGRRVLKEIYDPNAYSPFCTWKAWASRRTSTRAFVL